MEISCYYQQLDWAGFPDSYTCTVTSATITEEGIEIKDFIGEHMEGKSNKDVTALRFNNTVVSFFPRGIFKTFPNLKVLEIHNCGLKKVSRSDLEGLETLKTFYLQKNRLKTLPIDLFDDMRDLQRIFLSENKDLEFMSSDMLNEDLKQRLKIITLEKTKCVDAFYASGMSDSLKSLDDLLQIIDDKCKPPNEAPKDDNEEVDNEDSNNFKHLWESKNLSDFTIFVDESNAFQVHKIVLTSRSSVFRGLLVEDVKEMKLEEFDVKDVKDFLRYLYTGHLSMDFNEVPILKLATKFNIIKLKSYCENEILNTFTIGYLTTPDQVKLSALQELRKSFHQIKTLPDSLIFKPDLLEEIIKMKQKLEVLLENCDVT
ncbi:CLUMA_CG016755, isoform A [Clunio marinus]|uniref:CLUMA_CG016755, isoform A n=1 Tax=Clunio marinus TaxID=568069 RepID=A0A1J1ITQ8_9DIPT|nr:CLUMA_CG016755, isoform A [Clunio marinus]